MTRTPPSLRILVAGFLSAWVVVALFPLLWIAAMSFKLPVDGFSTDPAQVLLGPATRAGAGGLSIADLLLGTAALAGLYNPVARLTPRLARKLGGAAGWLLAAVVCASLSFAAAALVLPPALGLVDAALSSIPGLRALAEPAIGFTGAHYRAVWVSHAFYRNFENSLLVTAGVVAISLNVGTLAGYALARSTTGLAFDC